MINQQEYLQNRLRIGWGLLIIGAILIGAGLAMQFLFTVLWNARIVSGLGIFIMGLGAAQMARYHVASKDRQSTARLINEERDERLRMIRARAGSRGFWASLVMSYIALMWLSFAANGSLPTPSLDTLWFYLAATVVLPFLIYIGSIVYDQNNG